MKLSRRQYRVTCCWALILASVGGLWSILLVRNCLSIDQNPFTDGQTAYYAQSRGTCYRRTSRCTATVSASPSNTVAQMSSCFKAVPSRVQESCATIAASHVPDQTEITSLAPGSRQMPSVATESPVLAASNWDGQVNADHIALARAEVTRLCGPHLFRYRVVSQVIYADHNHTENGILKGHRNTFVETLLTAVWLYRSFPDVELWVSFADEPSRCSLNVPILQYAILNANITQAAQQHNTVQDADGSHISIVQLLTDGGPEPTNPLEPAPQLYRGWAFHYPFAWETLSLVRSALKAYRNCLQDKAGPKPTIPKVIWRGSNTGGSNGRGWGPLVGPAVALLQYPWSIAFINKRMALALLARSHEDNMDIGLHQLIPELMGTPAGSDQQLVDDLRHLLVRPYVPLDNWGCYALQLSIDGHGASSRLPAQYLQGNSVVLKMTSPYQDTFDELFKPGFHYEPFRYDLSNLVGRTKELLERFQQESSSSSIGADSMAAMAAMAAAQAEKAFSIYGQLDALIYAMLQVCLPAVPL
eukprot:GHRR01017687.1.p1 GENE.GHRR01017687.1~~GHRR01017687.1.p1  ORF type:complete len:530 (+),score=123.36 GHRR01017687.1:1099-2688(+)